MALLTAPETTRLRRPVWFRLPPGETRPVCPHCQSSRTHGHGSFLWKDGTRRPRRICRSCRRTFNPHTGTVLSYLKKRDAWAKQARGLGRVYTVRRMAAAVGVCTATAFFWRHRIGEALCRQPAPLLTDTVSLGETYVRYSEKGSRSTNGPGAWVQRDDEGRERKPFRRFRDGKASFVLLAVAGQQQIALEIGRGRPTPDLLAAALSRMIQPGAVVQPCGRAPYEQACEKLQLPIGESSPNWEVGNLTRGIFSWLLVFRGVATRYLPHYLVWHRYVHLLGIRGRNRAGRHMLEEAFRASAEAATRPLPPHSNNSPEQKGRRRNKGTPRRRQVA